MEDKVPEAAVGDRHQEEEGIDHHHHRLFDHRPLEPAMGCHHQEVLGGMGDHHRP